MTLKSNFHKHISCKVTALFISIFLSFSLYAEDWQTVFEHKGVKVETNIRKNGLLEYRGQAILNINSNNAWRLLLRAFEKCQPKMKGCLEQNIQTKNKGSYIIYQKFHLPWPLQNRDLVLLAVEKKVKKSYKLEILSSPFLIPENKNAFRIKVAYGFWEVHPAGKKSCVLKHRFYLEPGGNLNSGIANDRIRDIAIRTMNGIVKAVEP